MTDERMLPDQVLVDRLKAATLSKDEARELLAMIRAGLHVNPHSAALLEAAAMLVEKVSPEWLVDTLGGLEALELAGAERNEPRLPSQALGVDVQAEAGRHAPKAGTAHSALLLRQGLWVLTDSGQSKSLGEPTKEPLAGLQLGAWHLRVEPAPALAFATGDAAPRPVSLDAIGGPDAPQLSATVKPEYTVSTHEWIWRIAFRLAAGEGSPVWVALGDGTRMTEGGRTVMPGEEATFTVPPPTRQTYWVRIEWRDNAGRTREARLELPLLSDLAGDCACVGGDCA